MNTFNCSLITTNKSLRTEAASWSIQHVHKFIPTNCAMKFLDHYGKMSLDKISTNIIFTENIRVLKLNAVWQHDMGNINYISCENNLLI